MQDWYIAIVLSIVEGLTEFLPVSSTGHLILAGEMLGFSGEKAATFQVIIQLGAIMAVVVLYWPRFWGLLVPPAYPEHGQEITQPYGQTATQNQSQHHEQRLRQQPRFAGLRGIGLLILTSLPACVMGLALHSYIKAYLFTPVTVLMALVVGALFMIIVEKRAMPSVLSARTNNTITTLDDLGPKQALGIGFFQCLALWPGFSRSASTIMGGMLLGAGRTLAAEYSFIAAVPIMVAATGYDLLKSWHLLSMNDIPFFTLGIVASFLAALLAIKGFVSLLSRMTLIPFAVYRLIMAPLVYYFMLY